MSQHEQRPEAGAQSPAPSSERAASAGPRGAAPVGPQGGSGATEPLLTARGLEVGYRRRALLPPLELTVRGGEFWALMGRNGSGKTTLLRSLLGLLPRVGGAVRARPGLRVGHVPQRSAIDLSIPARVIDLVRDGRHRGWSFLRPWAAWGRDDALEQALADVAVTDLAARPFAELSEGQKQRVLMARALVSDPELLVLDEPTSAMDLAAERGLFELIARLQRRRGLAVLIVSHQLSVLVAHATHLVFVDKDTGFALSGPRAEVQAHPDFQARYGDLRGRRQGGAS